MQYKIKERISHDDRYFLGFVFIFNHCVNIYDVLFYLSCANFVIMHSDLIRFSKELNVHYFIAFLLFRRGIKNLAQAREFFNPSLANLFDPFLFVGMSRAVSRLKLAIDKGQKILIYGDYDTDGVCALSILFHFLKNQGVTALTYIPDRSTEGYGTTDRGIQYVIEQRVDLLITVDCGIRSMEHVSMLNQLAIDTIICDHHVPDILIPEAYVILNPHSLDEQYPEQVLCGAGVVFKLIEGMCRQYFPDYDPGVHLDFVAIATITDLVPLVGENRILAYHGIEKLRKSPHPSLSALLRVFSIDADRLSSRDIGFILGPCVNAAGRIGHAQQALDLFLSSDSSEYYDKACILKGLNEQRKLLQQKQADMAIENLEVEEHFVLSVNPDWHPGIVGLIANKLVEYSGRVAIILHHNIDSGLCIGSARSIDGFDITACLEQCSDLLERFGGHVKAAGLSIFKDKIPEFKARLCQILKQNPPKIQDINYDFDLDPHELTLKRIKILQRMQPFGPGNPEPIFRISNVKLLVPPTILKNAHIKFCLPNTNLEFIGFNKLKEFQNCQISKPMDIYFSASVNFFQNQEYSQFQIQAIKNSVNHTM